MTEQSTLKKRQIPFTQISNFVINDPRISLKAKGLFAYIESKPDGWQFFPEEMESRTTDGIASIRNGLKELETFGYLRHERVRDNMGRVKGARYFLNWEGNNHLTAILPTKQNTKQVKHQVGNLPTKQNHTHSNTDLESNTYEERNTDTTTPNPSRGKDGSSSRISQILTIWSELFGITINPDKGLNRVIEKSINERGFEATDKSIRLYHEALNSESCYVDIRYSPFDFFNGDAVSRFANGTLENFKKLEKSAKGNGYTPIPEGYSFLHGDIRY